MRNTYEECCLGTTAYPESLIRRAMRSAASSLAIPSGSRMWCAPSHASYWGLAGSRRQGAAGSWSRAGARASSVESTRGTPVVAALFHCCHTEHRHGGIGWLTPAVVRRTRAETGEFPLPILGILRVRLTREQAVATGANSAWMAASRVAHATGPAARGAARGSARGAIAAATASARMLRILSLSHNRKPHPVGSVALTALHVRVNRQVARPVRHAAAHHAQDGRLAREEASRHADRTSPFRGYPDPEGLEAALQAAPQQAVRSKCVTAPGHNLQRRAGFAHLYDSSTLGRLASAWTERTRANGRDGRSLAM